MYKPKVLKVYKVDKGINRRYLPAAVLRQDPLCLPVRSGDLPLSIFCCTK